MSQLRTLKWIPVSRKPKGFGIKLLNSFWANKIDSGETISFGYWSKDKQKWVAYDKNATEIEGKGNGTHPSMTVTHWAEPSPLYAKHKLTNPWKKP